LGGEQFFEMLKKVLAGDIETQKEIFNKVKQLFYDNGFKDEINEWDGYFMG
jgi:hypothetical protein